MQDRITNRQVVVRLYRALFDQSYDDDDWSLALALLDEWLIDLSLAIEDGHEHDQVRLATSARLAGQTLREALLALEALQERADAAPASQQAKLMLAPTDRRVSAISPRRTRRR
jgi:hypothetical protein